MHWLEQQFQHIKHRISNTHPKCKCQENNVIVRIEVVKYMNTLEGMVVNLEKRIEALEKKNK